MPELINDLFRDLKAKLSDPCRLPLVMGILNVTPDSFSDGGRFVGSNAAISQAEAMVQAGADLIDIGGESTRPGAQPIRINEQIRRVVPVIESIRTRLSIVMSIDTTQSAVAAAALDAGAHIVNDVSAGRDDPALLPLVAQRQVPVILMHMRGTPLTMQQNPSYTDVVSEVKQFLIERTNYARTIGIQPADLWIDPGIGFGKTPQHDLQLLNGLSELRSLGYPIVVGASRKKFIGAVTGEPLEGGRQFGTAAAVAWAAMNGAAIVRVHDVEAMSKIVTMIRAIGNSKENGRSSEPNI